MRAIEKGLGVLPGVEFVRVNLSTKRVRVHWRTPGCEPKSILSALRDLGFEGHIVASAGTARDDDPVMRMLVRCLAVTGFGAANVMGLSISVWSGADPATQWTFHWISAAIAIPCALYGGRPFFGSAYSALRAYRLNMDVPISLAILLALALSLYETITKGGNVYFDAAITLPFLLLIGRTLDHSMRERARSVVKGLQRLSPRGVFVKQRDGTKFYQAIENIQVGTHLSIEPGERLALDGVVTAGRSDVDCSFVTGESWPETVEVGSPLRAGMVNLTGTLDMTVSALARDSFLGEIIQIMAQAEDARPRQSQWADRAAEIYAPAVHGIAAFTFAGWLMATGDWHLAITTAVAVLIITCPCALGLAIPIVQVVAIGRLLKHGILAKGAGALERLANVDTVIFDKTGTLTLGRPKLRHETEIDEMALSLAAAMAKHARHPLSQCLHRAAIDNGLAIRNLGDVIEQPGFGLEADIGGVRVRLGKRDWCVQGSDALAQGREQSTALEAVLSEGGKERACFHFDDLERRDARAAIASLISRGYAIEMLSGDHAAAVAQLADSLGISRAQSGCLPQQKSAHIEALENEGRTVLMIGDGLNDCPALQAASISMSPSSAIEISRNAADLVFLRESLMAVPLAINVAKRARTLIMQNLVLAVGYNMVAVPIAVFGFASPLMAAIAMSSSSLLVTLNALRLGLNDRRSSELRSGP